MTVLPAAQEGAAPEPGIVDVFNLSDSNSLINRVPPAAKAAFLRVQEQRPELLGLDERSLWKRLRLEHAEPNATDNRVRIKFWIEYDRAVAENDRLNIGMAFVGVCTRSYFYDAYLGNPLKVAWLLCPPANYTVKMEEILDYGMEQLRDILDLPNVDKKGVPNVKLMELKAKIIAMAHDRLKGAVAQKIEQRNMNLNINSNDKQVAKLAMEGTMDGIQKRLKELERRDRLAITEAPTETLVISEVEDAHGSAATATEG